MQDSYYSGLVKKSFFLTGFHLLFSISFILSGCTLKPKPNSTDDSAKDRFFVLEDTPLWGTSFLGQKIFAGGCSGLIFLGKTESGEYRFMTMTDRGPNGEPVEIEGIGSKVRPFILPEFQPRWVLLETDRTKNRLKIIEEIFLTDKFGAPLSGLPQWAASESGTDEVPVDMNGKVLPTNILGIDPESFVRDGEGNFWVGEEYRPSLLKFSPKGKLLKRFIPKNSLPPKIMTAIANKYGSDYVVEALPEKFGYRKVNRGFEGIAFANNKIYALTQSPLETGMDKENKVSRLLEFDIQTETSTAEFLYPFKHKGADKLGDLVADATGKNFYAIEQNSKTGKEGNHMITRFQLGKESTLDVKKVFSMEANNYDFAEKVEGIALISDHEVAIINDNDFGMIEIQNRSTLNIGFSKNKKTVLGIFQLPKD